MCGIVAIINKNGNEPAFNLLKNMADVISYRGPDDEGWFIENNVGFYHKRLSIIDLKTGHQPMSSENYTIIFNGEIYNYLELRNELIKRGHIFKTTSDTEVILRMYEQYGLDSISELNGMFAFLIYDKQNNKIIAARDHFGIKPLYFYNGEKQIIFGSEIKAILAHPDVRAEVDYTILNEYLTFQFVLGKDTLFKNIYKIEPGNYFEINLNTFELKNTQYWVLDFSNDFSHTSEYFQHEINQLLHDTVRIQMRSDVKVGTYLSGGIDSSLVTILASKLTNEPISTFSGAFREGEEFNETKYSRHIVDICGAVAHEIYPTAKDFMDYMSKLIYHLDEPVAGPGLFPQYMVSKLASDNVKVVLGGQGGDEIFGGYARYLVAYLEQAIKGSINQTTEEGEHIVSLKTIVPNLPFIKNYIPMIKNFWREGVFESMDKRYFHLIDRLHGKRSYLTDDFAAGYDYETIFNKFSDLFNNPDTLSYYNKMTHFDMFGSLPALLQVEDRVSMAASIESRVPLLDKRIVNLVASMPPSMKFKGGELKYLLKQSVGHLLPEKIIQRRDKMGFPVPLHIWAKKEAKGFISDILLSKKCKERNIFNLQKIKEIISSECPFDRNLWGMLSLEIWFNTFIDKN